jgi:hypothetical protein
MHPGILVGMGLACMAAPAFLMYEVLSERIRFTRPPYRSILIFSLVASISITGGIVMVAAGV